ncbi:MAG TPA: NAD(+) synthase [Polyangiaceae bacterium]|jgi:NAD+ synthase
MFTKDALTIDPSNATREICEVIATQVHDVMRRRGVVVGLSGGVDSSVVAALCTRALGSNKVLGIFMPERDSSPESLALGRLVADHLGIETVVEDVTAALEGLGCYERQIRAVREVFPDYGPGWKCKVTLPSLLESERFSVSRLTVRSPSGEERTARMPPNAYATLVAATNFKQRARKSMEYFHADRLRYAVAGTPNRLEYDQGFFVKQGDGAADLKPIAHLYKTQVYALAEHLGVPTAITRRAPTTDTYSLAQTQEEFYFALDSARMDLCLYAMNHGVAASEVARACDLRAEQIERVFRDIDAKRRATLYLHLPPLPVEPVAEI